VITTYLNDALVECEKAFDREDLHQYSWQDACQGLGNILQGMARFEEAIFWHSLALEKRPYLVEVYTNLGVLYAQEKSWKEAVSSLKKAIKLNPNYADAYSYLAQIYSVFGRKEEGLELWYKTFSLKPQQADARAHYKLAKNFQERGKYNKAIACYQRAIVKDSNFLDSYYQIGNISVEQSNLDRAISYYQKIIEIDENQALAHHKLGNIWLKQNKFEEAIAAFRTSIQLLPEFPWSYRDLVKTLMQLEKWDEALATCNGIVNLVQEYPWVYVQMGNIFLKKNATDEAVSCFHKACELRGWYFPKDKNYQFTRDNFSYRIPTWESHLQPLIDRVGLQVLEIGTTQGMSTCWLLDKLLTDDSAKLVCVDTQFSDNFHSNIVRTGAASKVRKLEGDIADNLTNLESSFYDLVNIQDKRKLPQYIKQDAELAWLSLKIDGFLIFNDYQRQNLKNEQHKTQIGIDEFLNSVKDKFKILHQDANSHQLIIQKTQE
jgi:tetratricopeptide (TPR) repeat protein